MVLAGIYLVWFWITERTGSSQGGVVLEVESWSSRLSNWVTDLGGVRLGVIMSIIVALGAIAFLAATPAEPAVGDDT